MNRVIVCSVQHTTHSTVICVILCLLVVMSYVVIRRSVKVLFVDHPEANRVIVCSVQHTIHSTVICVILCLLVVMSYVVIRRSVKVLFVDHPEANRVIVCSVQHTIHSTVICVILCLLVVMSYVVIRRSVKVLFVDHPEANRVIVCSVQHTIHSTVICVILCLLVVMSYVVIRRSVKVLFVDHPEANRVIVCSVQHTIHSTVICVILCLLVVMSYVVIRRSVKVLFVDRREANASIAVGHLRLGLVSDDMKLVNVYLQSLARSLHALTVMLSIRIEKPCVVTAGNTSDPPRLRTVIANDVFTGNCNRLKDIGKSVGIMGILGMFASWPAAGPPCNYKCITMPTGPRGSRSRSNSTRVTSSTCTSSDIIQLSCGEETSPCELKRSRDTGLSALSLFIDASLHICLTDKADSPVSRDRLSSQGLVSSPHDSWMISLLVHVDEVTLVELLRERLPRGPVGMIFEIFVIFRDFEVKHQRSPVEGHWCCSPDPRVTGPPRSSGSKQLRVVLLYCSAVEGVTVICLANLVTLLTTISMSAVCTNGQIKGGTYSTSVLMFAHLLAHSSVQRDVQV
ncbi:hypothetical protein PR048_020866 [Dryococelus australis]|uniref:Uncharacterized protein n=1 Tax=Dryococelus australis TaxID=614101 RepID=A0ABQ9GWL7_9NEOP|nr:hypothetical protein PR048_020866 [Dryococelus australis]